MVKIRAAKPNIPDNGEAAYNFFIQRGLKPHQAAGIVGNLMAESSRYINPSLINKGDGRDGSDSIGIGQWNGSRAKALKNYAASKGTDWNDLTTQLEFLYSELNSTERKAFGRLLKSNTPEEATRAFMGFERPKDWNVPGSHPERFNNAKGALQRFGGDQRSDSASSASSAELTVPPLAGASSQSRSQPGQGAVVGADEASPLDAAQWPSGPVGRPAESSASAPARSNGAPLSLVPPTLLQSNQEGRSSLPSLFERGISGVGEGMNEGVHGLQGLLGNLGAGLLGSQTGGPNPIAQAFSANGLPGADLDIFKGGTNMLKRLFGQRLADDEVDDHQ